MTPPTSLSFTPSSKTSDLHPTPQSFNQAQMRKFQKIPISSDDDVLRSLLSSVHGLPFLPIPDVLDAWTEFKAKIWILYPYPAISSYISYFKKTWLFSTSYPISMWNVSSAVEYDEPRTNNASEGGNNALTEPSTHRIPRYGASYLRYASSMMRWRASSC